MNASVPSSAPATTIADKIAIVTGAASGIGAALAGALVAAGARGVMLADRDAAGAIAAAAALGPAARGMGCDVTRDSDLEQLLAATQAAWGPVDLYFSNAGILGKPAGIEADDALWQAMWDVHAMAHIRAARRVLPAMVARGGGYFMVTASAAGLLNIIESAPYAASKHAAVGIAEWLRITYGDQGIVVSCLCPQGVATAMTAAGEAVSAGLDGMLTPDKVAATVLAAVGDGRFLILPHPEVTRYQQSKAQDPDRWLAAMQKLRRRQISTGQ